MSDGKQVYFPPFTLDISNQLFKRGSEKISLRPKTLAVLAYLAEHPHRLVSRDELMSAAWPKAKVVGAALRVSIQEIRKALGDESNEPKFIETVGKKGYRFIAPVSIQLPEAGGESLLPVVGRAAELEQLRHHLEIANSGKRQIVFVSGEPGIGKTTLVEAFLKTLAVTFGVVTAIGLCIEQFGAGEVYLPIFDLLEQLLNSSIREPVLDCLRPYAPSWLANLPIPLLSAGERAEVARQTTGMMPETRMREITTVLESISKAQTLVLVLEDLHWADPSTLAFISFVARRRESARLMVIGTYRESEAERSDHPLKAVKTDLQLHHYCSHLPLKLLHRQAVGEYLAARFEVREVSSVLSSLVYHRSEGNPLLMVNVTDYLAGRGAITQKSGSVQLIAAGERELVPETIRGLVLRQIRSFSAEDQELLETASVGGTTFSVISVARALDRPREQTEGQFRVLAERTHFLADAGVRTRPKGRGTPRYSFVHALYQNVIYESLSAVKRRCLHQIIGEFMEAAYGVSTEIVATELAVHFERSGDRERAVKYLLQAAQRSFSLCAYDETVDHATRALTLAESLPATTASKELELNLELLLALSVCGSKGYAAAETGRAFASALQLSSDVDNDDLRFQALAGVWSFYLLSGDLPTALKQAQDLLAVAEQTENNLFLLNAHVAMALSFFYQGHFETAHDHLERAIPHYEFDYHRSTISLFGWDPGVLVYCYDAQALWFLGFAERAERAAQGAIDLAKKLSSPFNEALCYAIHATYYAYRRDAAKTLAMAEAALKVSNDRGFLHWIALASINKGWSLCRLGKAKEGLATFLDGLKRWKSTGAEMAAPTFSVLLAEIYQASGPVQKALDAIQEGLAISAKNNDHHNDAGLYRVKGEMLLKLSKRNGSSDFAEAEGCFRRAIDIAQEQKARALELRAALSLARLWKSVGKTREAYLMLKKLYGWFTEGFDTPDLKNAKALLDELN